MSEPRPHRGVRAAVAAGLVLALVATPRARGQMTATEGDIRVTVYSPVNMNESDHGYVPYVLSVHNRSAKTPHDVAVRLPRTSYGPHGQITRRTTIQPGVKVRMELLQGPFSIDGHGMAILVDGVPMERTPGMSPVSHCESMGWHGPSSTSGQINVLCSSQFGGHPSIFAHSQLFEPPYDGGSWLALSAFDGIVASADELAAAPPAARQAVMRYTECGGVLLVTGSWEPPESWAVVAGRGRSLRQYRAGFGSCFVANETTSSVIEQFRREVGLRTLSFDTDVPSAHLAFPVTDKLGVPVIGMLGLMFLFAIVIGPVNLIVMYRRGRRTAILWTIPLISLVTCGLVFGYAAVSEGFTADCRMSTVTVLDQLGGRATSVGVAGYYSPLTPDSPTFSAATEVTPAMDRGSFHPFRREQQTKRSIHWGQGQTLTGGWIQARIPAYLKLRKSERRRERVAVRFEGKTATVTNQLGVRITKLMVADAEGKVYTSGGAKPIEAGAEMELLPTTATAPGDRWKRAVCGDWLRELDEYAVGPIVNQLHPNTYVAVLEESPFLESGLPDAATHPASTHVVWGIYGEQN